ncbi:MAG: hypothetical protein NZV14_01885 [Bryobacteraceae bacterium]|nr:hypothetical protein [Bryobacteraceae bacterium]MDW8376879.1 hypothetical protein [Bryobacterales bacterium]
MIPTKPPAASQQRPEPNRQQVIESLNRILRSPTFQGSKRCQDLLQFLVLKRLEGDFDSLKERVIGAAIFGRKIDYDTSNDAIVRVKANEVRKRLAACYSETGKSEPLRIDLPVGSYVPVFRWQDGTSEQPPLEVVGQAGAASAFQNWKTKPQARRKSFIAVGLALGLAILFLGRWIYVRFSTDAFESFWAPFDRSDESVLLCIPARERWFFDAPVAEALKNASLHGKTRLDLVLSPGNVALVPFGEMSVQNFRAILQLATFLARRGAKIDVRLVSEVSAEAIRKGQVILLGAYHNPWAMELSSGLRYRFESVGQGSSETTWIRDRDSSGEPKWKVSKVWPYASQELDYAIISRTIMPVSRQVVVSVAGLNGFGTQVAAEFLSAEHYWNEFARLAPKGWEERNFQIVLETRIVRELPNPPRILAVHVW